MREVFLDATVFVLAAGGTDSRRQACVDLLVEVRRGRARAHVSTEAVQEFVFHRVRRGDAEAVSLGRDLAALCVLHPFDEEVLASALSLMEAGPVRGRDAVHAATAIRAGFTEIVSTDRDFEGVAGLRRVDPAAWAS